MAMLEAARVHTGLLPSCSGKASCCGFENFSFKLYLSSAVGATTALPCPFGLLPAPVLARGAARAPCVRPLPQTPKLRFLRIRSKVPWGGLPRPRSNSHGVKPSVKTGWRGCRAAFSQFYQHLTNCSQASCFAVCFLRLFVHNIFFQFHCGKLLSSLSTLTVAPSLISCNGNTLPSGFHSWAGPH